MFKCPHCKKHLITKEELGELKTEAVTRAKGLAKKVTSAIADILVEDSSGCIFCDLDIEPQTIEGKKYHTTRHGVIRCSNKVS